MTLLFSKRNPNGNNIRITKRELDHIRQLGDFDLTMLLSELDDFGWERKDKSGAKYGARLLLPMIRAVEKVEKRIPVKK